jgi:hypothetical protein
MNFLVHWSISIGFNKHFFGDNDDNVTWSVSDEDRRRNTSRKRICSVGLNLRNDGRKSQVHKKLFLRVLICQLFLISLKARLKKINHYQLHVLLLLAVTFLGGFVWKLIRNLVVLLLLLYVIWRVLMWYETNFIISWFFLEGALLQKKDEAHFFKYKIDGLSSFIDY